MLPNPPLRAADQVQLYKHAARSIAAAKGLSVSFLARPFEASVAGMPLHVALNRKADALFHDSEQPLQLSELSKRFAAGWLQHAPALMAWCAPTQNSYRRLGAPQGPVRRVLSSSDARALCRVPIGSTSSSPEVRRLKFCGADPSSNAYLALAALIAAGLDGIERLAPAALEVAVEGAMPVCLEAALEALSTGSGFLSRIGVSPAAIAADIAARYESEVLPLRCVPHPAELALERRQSTLHPTPLDSPGAVTPQTLTPNGSE
jgi:glutamine synthetase